jgi:hypothetical protein
MQLGWSLAAFRSSMPGTPIVQLAIDGAFPFAVIRDLSANTDFAGVVIVSLTPANILPRQREDAQGHVDFYANSWKLNTRLNFLADDLVQGLFVTRQTQYGVAGTATAALDGLPQRGGNYLRTTRERERNADYRRLDIVAHRAERVRRIEAATKNFQPPSAAVWNESMKTLDRIIRPMVDRGARVVFIRFPTSGPNWERGKQMFPREKYWDDLAKNVSGEWLHFSDIEGLDKFTLPDTSHLDQRDKAAFTRIIMDKLLEIGVY